MKLIRKPKVSAAIILTVTAFYALVFIVTSGHMELERMLHHAGTLDSPFWSAWSDFLARGNMKYIGYAFLVLAAAIGILAGVRKRDYDEYQAGILEKGLIAAGAAMACLFPLALLLILSDPKYSIETILLLVVVHWSAVLIADFVYVIRWGK